MNTTVSKSFGLALLLAVGIIAVMVAMGTFSAQKAGAEVRNTPMPTAELDNTMLGAEGVTLTITFELSQPVDGTKAGAVVAIGIPSAITASVSVKEADYDAGDVSVTQGGMPVGSVTVTDDTITIGEPAEGSEAGRVEAGVLTTVTIGELKLAETAARRYVTIGQTATGVRNVSLAIYDPAHALSDLSAKLSNTEVEAEGVTLTLKFSTAADQDDDVEITLPKEYDVQDAKGAVASITVTEAAGGKAQTKDDITRGHDGDGDTINIKNIEASTTYTVKVGQNFLKADNPTGGFTNEDEPSTFKVKFAQGSIIPPAEKTFEITPPPPPVALTTNTQTGGATAQVIVEVASGAETDIGDQITIDMGKFGLPSSIDEDDVSLRGLSDTGSQEQIGTPELVDISKSKVTLTVPDMNPSDDEQDGLKAWYRVVFSKDAGVTIPTAPGTYSVSWDNADGDTIESNSITVATSLSISPVKGGRNTEITLKGTAWANGTTGIYWLDGDVEKFIKDVIAEDNSFATMITSPKGFIPGNNTIRAKGADGIKTVEGEFELKGTMEVSPATVDKGGIVKITLTDWEEGDVNQARIGGVDVDRVDKTGKDVAYPVNETLTEDGEVIFYVKVGEEVRLGTKTVSLLDDDDKRIGSEEIEIGALSLSVTPDTAVAGQQVTVSGSGFARGSTISGEVQSKTAEFPADSDEATSSGRITVTFTIPAGVTHGTRTIEITDDKSNVGQVSLTVPEPAITVNPESSKRGSRLTITGSGFPANENVTVKYAGDNQRSVRSDGTGSWNTELGVPSGADIGEDATVEAIATSGTEDYIGKATHSVPAQTIALGSDTASSGNTLDISGDGFPRYASVKVVFGSHDPVSLGVNTDDNGSFPATSVLVPGLDKGTIIVRVTVNGITATELLEIVDAPVVRTVEEAFGALIDNGSLQTIWAYDFDTGGWSSYTTDPETAFANDLFEVDTGDILYINVTGQQSFSHQKGETLPDGWSLITLK